MYNKNNNFEIRKNGELIGSITTSLNAEEVQSILDNFVLETDFLDLDEFIDHVLDLKNDQVCIERFFFDSVIDL